MEQPTWHRIHPDFSLDSHSLALKDLIPFGQSLLSTNAHERLIGDFLLAWASDAPFVEVQTSGSTGIPKTIRLKKQQMVNSALATGKYFGLKAGDSALLCLPCNGIAGKMMLVRSMVLGLALDRVEPSSTPLSGNHRTYDFVAMVPLQLQKSLPQIGRIGTLIIGGAPLDSQWKEALKAFGTRVHETYGMTETISHIAVKEISPDPSPYFRCLPQVTISLDHRGCLVIDAPGISDRPVVTNDLVELLGENAFKWLGRHDSIINSGGVKLFPERIEEKLAPLMAGRFFVAGIPDSALGQKLVLIVEGKTLDKDRLLQRIQDLGQLSKYEIPKEIHFVEAFEQTGTQKVHRKRTLERIF